MRIPRHAAFSDRRPRRSLRVMRRPTSFPALLLSLAVPALSCRTAAPRGETVGEGTPSVRFEVPSTDGTRWYKGNAHTHTAESDGDSPPEAVIRWYKAHGYHWLAITDHDRITEPARFRELTDSAFVLVRGEEVTARFGPAHVHVNALNPSRVVPPRTDSTLEATLRGTVDSVRAAGGVPLINHPNFGWSLDARVLARARNAPLIEIASGHPLVNSLGGGGRPGVEAMWDELLGQGRRVYGMGVDDSHYLQGEFAFERPNPGRAWSTVRARSLDPAEIVRALEAGQFYASTGVELTDLRVTPTAIEVHVEQRGQTRYVTQFIGRGGRVLHETGDNPALFTLRGDEPYVRARVRDSNGRMAWVQPVFTR